MRSGLQLALEAIAHSLSLVEIDPEIGEIQSLLVQTEQVRRNLEDAAREAGMDVPTQVERCLTGARHSLSNGDSALAIEDLRDAVDILREHARSLRRRPAPDME